MQEIEILKEYNEDKIIALIERNELNVNLEKLLLQSINVGKNKLSKYLIDKGVTFESSDGLNYDSYLTAVSSGNKDIIKFMLIKGLDLYKKYNIWGHETYALSEVRDLETFKLLEDNNLSMDIFNKCIEDIICNTICNFNIELLAYLVDNYHVDITKMIYKTPYKNYSILEKTKELLDTMPNEKKLSEYYNYVKTIYEKNK